MTALSLSCDTVNRLAGLLVISGTTFAKQQLELIIRPGYIKQLKIKWEFLQPFPVLQRILLQDIMDKSTEGSLESIGNTMTVRKNLPEHRE